MPSSLLQFENCFPKRSAGVATGGCGMASLWVLLRFLRTLRNRLLLSVFRLRNSMNVAICWFLGLVLPSELSTPLSVLLVLPELMCVRKVVTAAATAACNVAASIWRIGVSLLG